MLEWYSIDQEYTRTLHSMQNRLNEVKLYQENINRVLSCQYYLNFGDFVVLFLGE